LWAGQWLSDVEGLERTAVLQRLLIMAIASSISALIFGSAITKLRQRGVGPRVLLGFIAFASFVAQLALILRLPLSPAVSWPVIAAVSSATVVSYAILSDYFPKALTGRANAALNVFHIGWAFAAQYAAGVVVQQWAPQQGHYPEIAYQSAFAVSLVLQAGAWLWFMRRMLRRKTRSDCNLT
jgi:hypothetical protein